MNPPRRAAALTALFSMGAGAWFAFLAASATLCACLTYWVVQLSAPTPLIAPHGDGQTKRERADVRAAAAMFGQPATAPAIQPAAVLANVQVLGVVAAGRQSSAILIVDGQPARSYAVGESVGPGQRISRVAGDFVVIDNNGKPAQVPAPERGSIAVLTAGDAQARSPSDPALASPVGAARGGAIPGAAAQSSPMQIPMPRPGNASVVPPGSAAPAIAPPGTAPADGSSEASAPANAVPPPTRPDGQTSG